MKYTHEQVKILIEAHQKGAKVSTLFGPVKSLDLLLRYVAQGMTITIEQKTLRPFTFKEAKEVFAIKYGKFPLIRNITSNGEEYKVQGVCEHFGGGNFSAVLFSKTNFACGDVGYFYLGDLVTYIGQAEYSLDEGETWQRCGVWE